MTRVALAAILLATLAVYWPATGNGFALDDPLQAAPMRPDGQPNAMVATLRPLRDYFAAHYWAGAELPSRLYRPITVLGYALTNAAGGGAFVHHLLNVLLHVWATGLVFALVRPFVRSAAPALVAAAAFGLHAVHSEVVAGIVGRAELLAFCGGAQALLLARGGALARVGAVLLAFVAFAGKESALVWVAFAPLWIALAPGASRRRLLVALALFVLPALAFLALRAQALAGLSDDGVNWLSNPLRFLGAPARIASALPIQVFALRLTVLPWPLVSEYGPVTFPVRESLLEPAVLGSAALLAGLLAGGLCAVRRAPLLLLAAAAFFGFSFVTSNLAFPIGTVFGERLLYAPSVALSFALAWLAPRVPRLPGALVLAAWLVFGAVSIVQRNAAWRDDAALLTADVATNPRSLRLLNEEAARLHVSGDPGESERAGALWERALALDPDHADALGNLAAWLAARGRFGDAERLLLRAREVPEHRRVDHRIDELLGHVYLELARPADAQAAFERVLAAGERAAAAGDRRRARACYAALAVEGVPPVLRVQAAARLRALAGS
jgi:tetratricopeptide (TPR) repeat protein